VLWNFLLEFIRLVEFDGKAAGRKLKQTSYTLTSAAVDRKTHGFSIKVTELQQQLVVLSSARVVKDTGNIHAGKQDSFLFNFNAYIAVENKSFKLSFDPHKIEFKEVQLLKIS
jgi:hypothetical protein